MAIRSIRTRHSYIVTLLVGSVLAVATMAMIGLSGASDRATADNGLYDCASSDPWPGGRGQLVRFNYGGYIWYGTGCGVGQVVQDIRGNPLSSDMPAPGISKINGVPVGVYEGDRVPTPICVTYPGGAPTISGCRSPRQPGDPTQLRMVLRTTWSTTPQPISDESGSVEYLADNDNRVVRTEDGNYYRETRVGNRWLRSTSYGDDETAKQLASWSAHYASERGWIGPPPSPTEPPPPSLALPESGPSGQGSPNQDSPSAQASPSSNVESAPPPSCEELYSHLPPDQRDLICSAV